MADEYWYAWYPGHYERDAGHLDHIADSCYRRLIDTYMRGGEPIKKDPIRLMYITRTTPQQFQIVWPQIEGFFTVIDGFLHLKRCNYELDRQDARKRFASIAGKNSAAKRKVFAASQHEQYQMLSNDRSTPVEQPFNDGSTTRATTGEDRTGYNRDIEIYPERESTLGASRKKSASRIRASAATLPEAWTPSELQIRFANEMGLVNGAIDREIAKFRAYWTLGKGSGTRRNEKGWNQTWVNWITRAADDPKNSRGKTHEPSRNTNQQSGWAAIIAEEAERGPHDGGE